MIDLRLEEVGILEMETSPRRTPGPSAVNTPARECCAKTHAEQNNNFHPVNKDLLEELLFLFFSSPSINIFELNAQMVLLLFVRIGSCFR